MDFWLVIFFSLTLWQGQQTDEGDKLMENEP